MAKNHFISIEHLPGTGNAYTIFNIIDAPIGVSVKL
ncbi:hypothetical protein R80B4_03032 [Fibrobacteres bacterium R8-0-B4]